MLMYIFFIITSVVESIFNKAAVLTGWWKLMTESRFLYFFFWKLRKLLQYFFKNIWKYFWFANSGVKRKRIIRVYFRFALDYQGMFFNCSYIGNCPGTTEISSGSWRNIIIIITIMFLLCSNYCLSLILGYITDYNNLATLWNMSGVHRVWSWSIPLKFFYNIKFSCWISGSVKF